MIQKKLLLVALLFITTLLSVSSAALFGKEERSIFEILVKDERFTKFLKQIEDANLTPEFKKIKSGTVFAPVNEAFDHKLITQRRVNANSLLYHVVPLSIETKDLWDGRVLETEARIDDVDQRVKVHKSLTRTVTLGPDNGQESAQIIDSNIEATNGVVHAIDKILPLPVYLDETLSLSSDTQEFYDYAKIAKINHELRNAQGNTIFVSKGEVFGDALSDYEKEYLLHQDAGRHDLARYLNHQIAPKVYYAGDFKEGKTVIKTVEGSEDLEIVVQNKTGFFKTITVNGVKIIHSDVLAANGNKTNHLSFSHTPALIFFSCRNRCSPCSRRAFIAQEQGLYQVNCA